MHRSDRTRWPLTAAVLAGVAALAAGCADSTIHKQSSVSGVDTLSVDAKQRLVYVANRSAGEGERVTCSEPMPDGLVARAAAGAASGNFTLVGGNSGGGGVSGGSSESAASIGFRNETVQLLRDGYFRMCEAYMNGALTTEQYQHMILNADTFMVVVSALQTLGGNPVAPGVAINAGGVIASVPKDGSVTTTTTGPTGDSMKVVAVGGTAPVTRDAKYAEMASQIVRDYLNYRYRLSRDNTQFRLALDKKRSSTKSY